MVSRSFLLLNLIVLLQFPLFKVHAESKCVDLYETIVSDNSLSAILKRTEQNVARAIEQEPLPITTDPAKRKKQKWKGTEGPEAFKLFRPKGAKFMATPEANSEDIRYLAMREHYASSSMLHVEMPFNGQLTSTTVYIGKPVANSSSIDSINGEYAIGKEFESAVWHIHGGGTPSAVAGNASSKGTYYSKRNVPVAAATQPEHGNADTPPMENLIRLVEWNLDLMDKMIHPDVKISLQGHSFGAMITIYVRLMGEKMDPKYKNILSRIHSYQAESPAADLSLGKGGPRAKAVTESEINAAMKDWERLAAPDDITFLKNIVENRKMSPVAQELTYMSEVFYRFINVNFVSGAIRYISDIFTRFAPFSKLELQRKKVINIVVGVYDGLVYVGREKAYDLGMKRIAGKRYKKLTEGKTFKGDKEKQGHQVYDLVNDNGDYVVYQMGLDLIKETTGQDISVIKNVDGDVNDTVTVLARMFNHYANNFAFREYISNHVEFVEVFNRNHKILLDEEKVLSKYLSKVESSTKNFINNKAQILDAEMKQFALNYNVKGGRGAALKNAKKELNVDHSPTRKALLEEYINKAKEAEAKAADSYVDEIYTTDLEKFKATADKELGEGFADKVMLLEQFTEAQKNLTMLTQKLAKAPEGSEEALRYQASINSLYNELNLKGNDRNLETVAEKVEELSVAPEDRLVDPKKVDKWKSAFARNQNSYKVIVKSYRRRFNENMAAAVNEIERPEGIKSFPDAIWEQGMPDLTQQRKEQLEAFIASFEQAQIDAVANLEAKILAAIESVELPAGFQSYDAVKQRIQEVQNILSKRFVPDPSDKNHAKIRKLVDDMTTLDNETLINVSGTIAQKASEASGKLNRLKNERTKLVNKINSLLEIATASERLLQAQADYKEKLAVLTDTNSRIAEAQQEFYIGLYERGELTPENILKRTPELITLTKEFEEALRIADDSEAALTQVKFAEAWQGNLVSENDKEGKQLKNALVKLLGEYNAASTTNNSNIEPAKGSIEFQIVALEKEVDRFETNLFKIQQKIYLLEKEYSAFFVGDDTNYNNFYQLREVNISELLNIPFHQLIEYLNAPENKEVLRAFRKTLVRWEDMWVSVLKESSQKTSDLYSVQ